MAEMGIRGITGRFYPIGFDKCRYKAVLEHTIPEEDRDPYPPFVEYIMDSGVIHEAEFFAELEKALQAEGRSIVFIDGDYHRFATEEERKAALAKAQEETLNAMREGIAAMGRGEDAPIIAGGVLPAVWVEEAGLTLVGKPDLLVPFHGGADALGTQVGDPVYLPVDVKKAKALVGGRDSATHYYHVGDALSPFLENARESDELGPGVPKHHQSAQLAHYYLMLLEVNRQIEGVGTQPPVGGIVDGYGHVVYYRLDAYYYRKLTDEGEVEGDTALDRYRKLIGTWKEADDYGRRLASGEDVTLPVWLAPAYRGAECDSCPFRKVQCEPERREIEHLTLSPDIGPDTSLTVGDKLPTPTLTALANADVEELAEALAPEYGFRSNTEDKVQVLIDGARTLKTGKTWLRRDSEGLPELEGLVEIHWDLETLPISPGENWRGEPIPNGFVYQSGKYVKSGLADLDGVSGRYLCRWADPDLEPWEAEARFIQKEAGYILRKKREAEVLYADLVEEHGPEAFEGIVPFRVFVWSHAERSFTNAVLERHDPDGNDPAFDKVRELLGLFDAYYVEDEAQLDDENTMPVAVDLLKVVKRHLHLPVGTRRLKTVAQYASHFWEVDDPSGAGSIVRGVKVYSDPDPKVRTENKQWLHTYNRGDVEATYRIREWLDDLRTNARSVAVLDEKFSIRIPKRANRRPDPDQLALAV